MHSSPFTPTAELCRRYRAEGFVTFALRAEEDTSASASQQSRTSEVAAPNFLESVVGVSLQDAREHLNDCVLYGKFDMDSPYKPTKVPPPNYLAELRPLVEAEKAAEREIKAQAANTAEAADVTNTKKKPNKPSSKPSLQHGKRRTVHAIDVHVCDTVFSKLASSPAIGEMVAALTGWGEEGVGVRLLETQVWMKPPRCTVPLAFHRDTPYFGFLSPLDICTVWFTFDDVSSIERAKHLGGLEYASGSHSWSQLGGIEGVFFDRDYRAPMKKAALENRLAREVAIAAVYDVEGAFTIPPTAEVAPIVTPNNEGDRDAKKLRPERSASDMSNNSSSSKVNEDVTAGYTIHYVTVPAGGVSFHNGMLWHGSGANLSDTEWRRGIGIHYIRADAQFKPEYSVYDEEMPEAGTGGDRVETGSEEKAGVPPPPKRPYLSGMWAPHKQKGSLLLNENRFPVIWQPSEKKE